MYRRVRAPPGAPKRPQVPSITEGCRQVAAATITISASQSGEQAGEAGWASLVGFPNQSERTNQHQLSTAPNCTNQHAIGGANPGPSRGRCLGGCWVVEAARITDGLQLLPRQSILHGNLVSCCVWPHHSVSQRGNLGIAAHTCCTRVLGDELKLTQRLADVNCYHNHSVPIHRGGIVLFVVCFLPWVFQGIFGLAKTITLARCKLSNNSLKSGICIVTQYQRVLKDKKRACLPWFLL